MDKPKIDLKLDETNNIEFEVSVKGLSSTNEQVNPITRFCITDNKSGISYMFPGTKKEDKIISFIIPETTNIFNESSNYDGKLEVLIGNRYFSPINVDVSFSKTLKVEAIIVNEQKNNITINNNSQQKDVVVQAFLSKAFKKEEQQPVKPKQVNTTTNNQPQKQLNKSVIETKQPVVNKPITQSNNNGQVKKITSKDLLKSLIKDALKDIK